MHILKQVKFHQDFQLNVHQNSNFCPEMPDAEGEIDLKKSCIGLGGLYGIGSETIISKT